MGNIYKYVDYLLIQNDRDINGIRIHYGFNKIKNIQDRKLIQVRIVDQYCF